MARFMASSCGLCRPPGSTLRCLSSSSLDCARAVWLPYTGSAPAWNASVTLVSRHSLGSRYLTLVVRSASTHTRRCVCSSIKAPQPTGWRRTVLGHSCYRCRLRRLWNLRAMSWKAISITWSPVTSGFASASVDASVPSGLMRSHCSRPCGQGVVSYFVGWGAGKDGLHACGQSVVHPARGDTQYAHLQAASWASSQRGSS